MNAAETLPNGWILAAAQPTADRCEVRQGKRCRCKVRFYLQRPGTRDAGYCAEHAQTIRDGVLQANAANANVPRIMESARMALRTTFRYRAALPSSPWSAYLGTGNGVIVARSDDPENPIMAHWRVVCGVNNARSDDANAYAIEQALRRMDLREPN